MNTTELAVAASPAPLALPSPEIMEQVFGAGDLSKLTPAKRLELYNATCQSLGLNPLSRPFEFVNLSGKLVFYARKDATEQLRKIHGVSLRIVSRETLEGVYVVTAEAKDRTGRTDEATGAVNIAGLNGEPLANAFMKAETKAKRRVTLSLCGMGFLDESEVSSIPDARTVGFDPRTGELDAPVVGAENAVVPVSDKARVTDQNRRSIDWRKANGVENGTPLGNLIKSRGGDADTRHRIVTEALDAIRRARGWESDSDVTPKHVEDYLETGDAGGNVIDTHYTETARTEPPNGVYAGGDGPLGGFIE